MLNGRLYLQAWFIATLALLAAFLTLRAPETVPASTQPVQFAGSATRDLAVAFREAAPLRVPGTIGAKAGENWIIDQFKKIPGGEKTLQVQRAVIRRNGQDVPITNVLFPVPAQAKNKVPRRILVVAARDAPRQVSWGTSGTAILVELARLSAQQKYHHPLIFLSVDGDTFGNAGLRWFLSKETASKYAGVIVLDAPGEGLDEVPVIEAGTGRQRIDPQTGQPMTRPAKDANTIYLWSSGNGRQALDMRRLAERAVSAAGFSASPLPSLRRQLLGLSFTETRGAQRVAIDRGIPAITLSARRESLLPVDVPPISRTRVRAAGNATLALIGLLDERERANVPDRALAYAGRILRPSVARLALLFLALPIFVMALDAAGRIRRSRVGVTTGLQAVAWRMIPALAALLLGWMLGLWGVLRPSEVGRPPSPADIPFDGRAALALLLIVLSALALAMGVRARTGHVGSAATAEAAGALIWLSFAVIVAWWHMPFTLVLILPAAHAVLAATIAPRLWQIVLLAVGGLLVPLALLLRVSGIIDKSPLFGLWYIVQTTFTGARGLAGPIIAVVVIVSLATLTTVTVARVREGLVVAGDVRKGIGWLTSNLSARKRPPGANDGDSSEKT